MRLRWIELSEFRSYGRLEFEPSPGVNVLLGPNGAGKTNLLEAISYLSSLRSFRGAPENTLLREGAETAVVRGEVETLTGQSLIEVGLFAGGRRQARVNRNRLRRLRDLVGHLRVVAFLPEDLDFVKRGPSYRRALLDESAVQLWPAAYAEQREFERALAQRNALLRGAGRGVEPAVLDGWDQRVATAGARVMERRSEVMERVVPRAQDHYSRLADRRDWLWLDYRTSWEGVVERASSDESVERLLKALYAARPRDLERGVSTVGPHRDDPVLMLGERDTRFLASQGEQRSVALALRLAVHGAVEEAAGEPPILVLDDVFSELDDYRAWALSELLPTGQSFVTSVSDDQVPLPGRRWSVEEGSIS